MEGNDGLRAGKWSVHEGGIRVPFLVQWKGRIHGGQVVREPVIALDVLPTALAAVGVAAPTEKPLDGINLIPLLEGKALPARDLHWRFGPQWAIRRGDWKLVKALATAEPSVRDALEASARADLEGTEKAMRRVRAR